MSACILLLLLPTSASACLHTLPACQLLMLLPVPTVVATAILTRKSAPGGTWLLLLIATTTTQALAGALVPLCVCSSTATLPFPHPSLARRRCYEIACQDMHLTDGYGKQRVRVGVGGRVLARHLPDCARYCGSSVTCSHGCWLGTCRIVPGTAAV